MSGLIIYSYVNGNPVSWSDPLGLMGVSDPQTGAPETNDSDNTQICMAEKPKKPKPKIPFCEGKVGVEKCRCNYELKLAGCMLNFICIMNAKRELEACILGDDINNHPNNNPKEQPRG